MISSDGVGLQLTPEIVSLLTVAQTLTGDGLERNQIDACDRILEHSDLPAEVRRWAFLRRVLLYAVTTNEDKAFEICEEWISQNPGDPINFKVRQVQIQMLVWRRSQNFHPDSEDIIGLAQSYMQSVDPASVCDIDYIEFRQLYAQGLSKFSNRTGDRELLSLAVFEAQSALNDYRNCIQNEQVIWGADTVLPEYQYSLEQRLEVLADELETRRGLIETSETDSSIVESSTREFFQALQETQKPNEQRSSATADLTPSPDIEREAKEDRTENDLKSGRSQLLDKRLLISASVFSVVTVAVIIAFRRPQT